MSTVTKPVILDETAQTIASRLNDIKSAIQNQSSTLNNLQDVNITNVANNQTLHYDSATSQWVNGNIGNGDMLVSVYDDDNAVATAGGIADYVAGQISGIESIQKSSLPTAAAANIGKIYQYIGATNANYTNGYFYKCVENGGAYSWQAIRVQAGGGTFSVSGETVTYNNA